MKLFNARAGVRCLLLLLAVWPSLAWGQVNAWTNKPGGKWETGGNWSLGIAPNVNQSVVIANGTVVGELSKVVTIDGTTASNFPATMTVTNATLSGLGLLGNYLVLRNAGLATPLEIRNALTLTGQSIMLITNSALLVYGLANGFFSDDGAVVLQSGNLTTRYTAGSFPFIFTYSAFTVIGNNGTGTFFVGDGVWNSGPVQVGSSLNTSGTLTLAGGSNSLVLAFSPGGTYGTLGVVNGGVWLTGGHLELSGGAQIGAGGGVGQMTVSGGVWSADSVTIGQAGSVGTLTLAGGTNVMSNCDVGAYGVGNMLISSGAFQTTYLDVGKYDGSLGKLTASGGKSEVLYQLQVGVLGTGDVLLTGGQLAVTNGPTYIGLLGRGRMTISNGLFAARDVHVGFDDDAADGAAGFLTLAGGACSAFSNMVLGNGTCTSTGTVLVAGGELQITNALTNAVLDIRSGTFTLTAGTVTVDRIVMTNTCGFFAYVGGTLHYKTLVVAPGGDADGDGLTNGWEQVYGLDPLRATGEDGASGDADGDGLSNLQEQQGGTIPTLKITGVQRVGAGVSVSWNRGGSKASTLQSATSLYSNNFTDAFTVPGGASSSTNYVDPSSSTNPGSGFYRIGLAP